MITNSSSKILRGLFLFNQNHAISILQRFLSTNKTLSSSSLKFDGIFPPLTTPFKKNGDLDKDATRKNMEFYQTTPLKGYVVFGSNGEANMLSMQDKANHVKFIHSIITSNQPKNESKRRLILAGVNAESNQLALQLSQMYADSGADALLVATPCFYKSSITHDCLVRFYSELADASPIPLLIYNVPAFTGVDVAANTVITLAKHPNILGMKESNADLVKITQIVDETKNDNFQVTVGSGSFLMPGLLMGAVGGIMALANVLPHECEKLQNLVLAGDLVNARQLQGRLIQVNQLLTRRFSVAGLKSALDMIGLHGGYCRSPLLEIQDADKKIIRNAFIKDGFDVYLK